MQRPLLWMENVLAGIRFNSLTISDSSSSDYLLKTRCRHAPLIVPLANWYAARLGIRMRVLARSAWLRYEPQMYHLLLGRCVSATRGMILLPRLPGCTLLGLLQKNAPLNGEWELGLSLAAAELARLHTCWTPHPWNGGLHQFSHADATIENVLVDTAQRRAHWIDFETTHEPTLPAVMRHADDLLTLLCSAAAVVEPEQLPRLFQILLRSYSSKPVAEAMLDLIDLWGKHTVARRLAIPALTDNQWQVLQTAVGGFLNFEF